MPELMFRTRECARHGHPEFTLRFREPLLVPDLEQSLMRFLEGSVARGARFAAGETLRYGWATLRFKQRGDGTLGLEAQSSKNGEDSWDEFVDETLMQVCPSRPSSESRVPAASARA